MTVIADRPPSADAAGLSPRHGPTIQQVGAKAEPPGDVGPPSLLPSFFVGGFECSSHRLRSGRRLDLLESTGHLRFVEQDYDRLVSRGIRVAREGLVWHRVERAPHVHDFATALPILRASRRTGVRVIWDLMHFGWPDDLDIFRPAFVTRFAALARAFATLLASESDEPPWISPVNEVSFLAWAGGDVQAFNPFCTGRGFELKCQLARASIAAIEAFREIAPRARVVVHDPAYHVVPDLDRPGDAHAAEESRLAQFQGLDLVTGRLWPQLGGRPGLVDLIGVNYYPWNQWTFGTPVEPSTPISRSDARYRPFSRILEEWSTRFGLPVYVGETGCEGDERAPWLAYVCDEVRLARAAGHRIDGVCLYPIVNFPGWDNDRHCENGLWDYADETGHRPVDAAYAAELDRQTAALTNVPRTARTAALTNAQVTAMTNALTSAPTDEQATALTSAQATAAPNEQTTATTNAQATAPTNAPSVSAAS